MNSREIDVLEGGQGKCRLLDNIDKLPGRVGKNAAFFIGGNDCTLGGRIGNGTADHFRIPHFSSERLVLPTSARVPNPGF